MLIWYYICREFNVLELIPQHQRVADIMTHRINHFFFGSTHISHTIFHSDKFSHLFSHLYLTICKFFQIKPQIDFDGLFTGRDFKDAPRLSLAWLVILISAIVQNGLQSCCCPVQKICPERLNWPGTLAGIYEGASRISK